MLLVPAGTFGGRSAGGLGRGGGKAGAGRQRAKGLQLLINGTANESLPLPSTPSTLSHQTLPSSLPPPGARSLPPSLPPSFFRPPASGARSAARPRPGARSAARLSPGCRQPRRSRSRSAGVCVCVGALRVWGGGGVTGLWVAPRVGGCSGRSGCGSPRARLGGGGDWSLHPYGGFGTPLHAGFTPPPLIFFPSLSQSCMWRELGYRARACDGIFGLTS